MHISIAEKEKVVLKLAKKTEFTQLDRDNLVVVGESIRNSYGFTSLGRAPQLLQLPLLFECEACRSVLPLLQ